ncbi:hypothetical protein [Nocardioides flavescens]|uniref:hypothetical protein n=1 Tax=Nocardioides flavescens TaxID=2691959 RepID=UPI001927B0F0
MADPHAPTEVARHLADLHADDEGSWDVDVVSEPFTTGSEDVRTAVERLEDRRRDEGWDLVVGLTELPLHDEEGGHLLVDTDTARRVAVVSLPALGGVRRHARARRAVGSVVRSMTDEDSPDDGRVSVAGARGRARVLTGMVLANRPWLLVPGLKSALVAALATGAVATVNSTVWVLADSLSWWRLVVASVVSVGLVVGWLVVDAELWDRPDDDTAAARHRSRLYNASTLATLLVGVLICYLVLYLINLLWALFVLDPSVVGSTAGSSYGYGDLAVLAWFVASAATVGGGLGSGLESDEAVRAAAYSKREEERRNRLEPDADDDDR